MNGDNDAAITRVGVLTMEVCVHESWSDIQVKSFADGRIPCGTELGWCVCKKGNKLLKGVDERVTCPTRSGYVHLMLDA